MNANDAEEIRALLANQPKPVCADLTPFEIIEAARESGYVKIEFAPQPAFENHFGDIQGGFAVSMVDVVVSMAAYVKLQQWIPTVEIKASFIAPAKIGNCIGEGRVIRAGRSVVFVEGKLWNANDELAVHATATLMGARTGTSAQED
jgi:uncharacterized protein (TIGR00369 family)